MNESLSLPALLGGVPIRPQGPPEWPFPDDEILQALEAAYRDGSWGTYQGGQVQRLEESLALYHGVEFALTCGSGTFAVELALRSLKIGPGDEVLMAAYDYPGNFLCVHAVGATPVLVDVHPDNWNLTTPLVSEAISPASRVILASHLHGGIVPMREVMALADRHGLKVIEDAAQMPGARVQGRKAGTWGDVGILSFGGSKLLTAGRGGTLLTHHADLHQRARTHQLRGNILCPLSELQAAVLVPQLKKLDARNNHRSANVCLLKEGLRDIRGLRCYHNPWPESEPGYYKLGFQLDAEQFGLARDRFVAALRAEGIAFADGFRALHVGRSPSRYRLVGDLKEAEKAHHGTVILHHPVLLGSEKDIEEIVRAVRKIYANAGLLTESL